MSGKHHADEQWQETGRAAPEQRKGPGWIDTRRDDDEGPKAADFDERVAAHHREIHRRNQKGR